MKKNNIILIITVFLSALAGTALAVFLMNRAGFIGAPKEDAPVSVTQPAEPSGPVDENAAAEGTLVPSVAASGNMFDGLDGPDYTGEEADKLNNEILLKYKKILLALDNAITENVAEGAVDSVRGKCHTQVYDYDGDGLYEMVTTFTANGKDIFAGLYRYTAEKKYGAEDIVRVTCLLGDMSRDSARGEIRIGKSGNSLFLHCVYTWNEDGVECGEDHIYCIDRENIYHITSLDWTAGSDPEYRRDGVECTAETFNTLFSTQSYRVSSYSADSPGFNLEEVFG